MLARDEHRCRACGATAASPHWLHVHHVRFRSRGGLTREDNLVSVCVSCHGLLHEGRLFATGPAPAVEFRNRSGDRLVPGDAAGSAPPRFVLRLLRGGDDRGG